MRTGRYLIMILLAITETYANKFHAGFFQHNERHAQQAPPAVGFFQHSARCYSCMSRLYDAVWPMLSGVYRRPLNFTDECNDDHVTEGRVPVVECPTICVSMVEEVNIAGVRVKGHIRGCMNDVLINGFNQTIVGWYRWMHRDSCRPYRKRELFKLPGYGDDSSIEVCTCYADHCNGNSSSTRSLLLPLLLLLLLLAR